MLFRICINFFSCVYLKKSEVEINLAFKRGKNRVVEAYSSYKTGLYGIQRALITDLEDRIYC